MARNTRQRNLYSLPMGDGWLLRCLQFPTCIQANSSVLKRLTREDESTLDGLACLASGEVSMTKHSCLAIVAVLMLATSASAVEKPHKLTKLSMGVYLASEFDAATTYHVLQDCGNRCYEANPMVRPFAHNPGIFVVLGASAYSINYLAGRLENGGHHRWATVLRVVTISMHVGAGAEALALEH